MKRLNTFSYLFAATLLSFSLVLVNCSGTDDTDGPTEDFNIAGTYCLNFSLVGSEMVISATNTQGTFDVAINDYDGGLWSGSGSGTLDNNTLNVSGTMATEAGTANFELDLAINESQESVEGIFHVLGPQGSELFNSSLKGVKGACAFELSPDDISDIIGQPYLTALHVELDKIEKISRYRSAAGHNFVDYSGESCVNLKHYFHTYDEGEPPAQSELPSSLNYFVPANGTIVTIGQARPEDDPEDYEIDIQLDANPNIIVRVFHLTPSIGIEVGASVSAGDVLGASPSAQLDSGDFAVYVKTNQGYRLLSMFEIMSNEILNEYIARGVSQNWRQDLYYDEADDYPSQITCENGTWGNLRHPESRFELDFFVLDN